MYRFLKVYDFKFRCLEYSINVHHTGYIPVKANVTQLTLSLSTTQLTLAAPNLANNAAGECINILY